MSGIKLWLNSKVSKYSYFTNKEYIQDISLFSILGYYQKMINYIYIFQKRKY